MPRQPVACADVRFATNFDRRPFTRATVAPIAPHSRRPQCAIPVSVGGNGRDRHRGAASRDGMPERGGSAASCATTATCAVGLDAIGTGDRVTRIPAERLREIELGPTSTWAEFAGLATARSQRPRGQSMPALATSDYRIDGSTRPVPSHRQVVGNLKRLSLYRYRRRR